MGDFLKIWSDLQVMSKILPIGVLQHYFQDHDPFNSKSLRETMNHFQMRDLEATDYRSAYHQFSDWLYGWSVSDGVDQQDLVRQPREINMSIERETQDAQRLMKTFETLTSLSLRHLKVLYNDIEQEMPRLGQGLDTYKSGANDTYEDDALYDEKTVEKVWGDRPAEVPIVQDQEFENGSRKNSLFEQEQVPLTKSNSKELFEQSLEQGNSKHGSFQFLAKVPSTPSIPMEREHSEKSDLEQAIPKVETNDPTDEPIKALRRDIDHVFREIDQCIEYTLVAISAVAAVLSFAELLNDKELFNSCTLTSHEMSQGFVSNTLKTIWDLLNRELPNQTSLATLRNPVEFKLLMQQMISLRAVDGVVPKLKIRKLHHKLTVIHDLFVLMDIHLFPNFAHVHKEGCIDSCRNKVCSVFCF
jgi:hypothetical protein